MIRQAINCDMCGAERLESTSFWFVADEVGGEIRLRGWESPKSSRRKAKHLCGQKCVQRMMDNFTASILAGLQAGKIAKEALPEGAQQTQAETEDRDDMPILERMGYDRETVALIEADSWAGPVKPREEPWAPANRKKEEKSFLHAAPGKHQPVRSFQRMA